MGKLVLKDASITVDGVDLSDHFSSITIETTFDEADATGFGSTYREILQGLGDATISGTVQQDFDAASVDATLWPLSQSGEAVAIVVKPTSDAVSATNPSYTMQGSLFGYSPLSGSVGDVSTTDISFRNASSSGLVKATS